MIKYNNMFGVKVIIDEIQGNLLYLWKSIKLTVKEFWEATNIQAHVSF